MLKCDAFAVLGSDTCPSHARVLIGRIVAGGAVKLDTEQQAVALLFRWQ